MANQAEGQEQDAAEARGPQEAVGPTSMLLVYWLLWGTWETEHRCHEPQHSYAYEPQIPQSVPVSTAASGRPSVWGHGTSAATTVWPRNCPTDATPKTPMAILTYCTVRVITCVPTRRTGSDV